MNLRLHLSNLEYVTLRLIRRWLVPGRLLATLQRILPDQYMKACAGTTMPQQIVGRWEQALASVGRSFQSLEVLEIGPGASNATGEVLLARGAGRWIGMDPYFPAAKNAASTDRLSRRQDLSGLPAGHVDAIVSFSVLEHVRDPEALFAECQRVLKPGGFMIHIVDYRDHFFKYPFHFLQFSKRTWERWLDPGDLPRWRLSDHLRFLTTCGFAATVIQKTRDDPSFARLAPHVSPDFAVGDPDMAVVEAVLFATAG